MTSIALELPTGCQLIGSHVTRTYVPRVAYTHCTAVRSTQYAVLVRIKHQCTHAYMGAWQWQQNL